MSMDESYEGRLEALTAFNPLCAGEDFRNMVLEQSNRNIKMLLAEVNPRDLVIALKGCDKMSITKVLSNLPEQTAMMVMEDIEYCGHILDEHVLEAQEKIKSIYGKLKNAEDIE